MLHKKGILVIPLFLVLVSCGNTQNSDTPIGKLIKEARKGFTMQGIKLQNIYETETQNFMYSNETFLDYSFENKEEVRTNQSIKYKQNGEDIESEVSVVRNKDGYVAQEYLNYKNEVDHFLLTDENGSFEFYDTYFLNPFMIVTENDFEALDENTYLLNNDKLNKFNFFLTGDPLPLKEMKFIFKENNFDSIELTSIKTVGKAYDYDKKIYVAAEWDSTTTISLSEIGTTNIENIKTATKKDDTSVSSLLNKIGDNYTVSINLKLTGEEKDDSLTKVGYFDGEKYYIDNTKGNTDLSEDVLYQKDEFSDDNLFYEFKYNVDSESWVKTPNNNAQSFNIFPKTKEYFLPNLNKISVDLFEKDGNKYVINELHALPLIGNAFLSEAEANVFFALGYGLAASIEETSDNNVVCDLKFYYVMSQQIYSFDYEVIYSDIGTTTLPIRV